MIRKKALPMIEPADACKLAVSRLYALGYLRTEGGIRRGSSYYSKPGMMHRKIRVSDHTHEFLRFDVVAQVAFDGPTLGSDVEFQVKRADEAFRAAQRNEGRKRR